MDLKIGNSDYKFNFLFIYRLVLEHFQIELNLSPAFKINLLQTAVFYNFIIPPQIIK